MEDVRADDLRQRQRIDEHHHEPEEGAAADRGEADDEAEDGADGRRDQLVAAREQERRVGRLDPAPDDPLEEEAEPAGDERRADRVAHDRVGRVAVAVLQPVRCRDASQRERA